MSASPSAISRGLVAGDVLCKKCSGLARADDEYLCDCQGTGSEMLAEESRRHWREIKAENGDLPLLCDMPPGGCRR